MENSKTKSNSITSPMTDMFIQTNQFIKTVITTVEIEGVVVTITAEPKVIEIKVLPTVKPQDVPEKIKRCINEAIQKSMEKVFEKATREIQNKEGFFGKNK